MNDNTTTELKTKEVNENKLAIAGAIIPFAIAGALIRIALRRLEDYPGAPVFNLVYAQWIGCFIMGIVGKTKNHMLLWYLPSHPAISTGLCGSITTFSSWQLGIFMQFANYNAYPHTKGKNVLSAISEFLVTMAMSLNGLRFGQHIGEWLTEELNKRSSALYSAEPKVVPRGFSARYLSRKDYFVIVFGIISWLGVLFAAIFSHNQRELAFACVFAPAGALLRWLLSFYNGKMPKFPIGTYIANIFGTIVIAGLAIVETSPNIPTVACDVVLGLADGFCGCLTTISTFMVELTTLSRKHSYIYGISSVVVGQCFMFIMLGSYVWSQGVNPSCGL